MGEMISVTKNEYEEYLELKRERDETIKHVDECLQALKQGKVYDL